jgi:hypothetical protein
MRLTPIVSATDPAPMVQTPRTGHVSASAVFLDVVLAVRTDFHVVRHRPQLETDVLTQLALAFVPGPGAHVAVLERAEVAGQVVV